MGREIAARPMMRGSMGSIRHAFCVIALAALAACGGGGGGPSSEPAIQPAPLEIATAGVAVIKVQSGAVGIAALEQRLTALTEPGPDRSVALYDIHGTSTGRYAAPAGFSVIDFCQHPSGELTIVLATAKQVRLARLDRSGATLASLDVSDPQAATDPFFDTGGIHDDGSLLPIYTRDAVRVAAAGEDVVMALRTGRNATVAYRFNRAAGGAFSRAWRTLAEPGFSVFAIGITSGSFDTFDALISHWQVKLDVDASGNVAIGGVSHQQSAELFATHSRYFGDAIAAVNGVLVTRIAADGTRLGATAIDTHQVSELYGLRVQGDDIAVTGRVFTVRRDDGGGWDGYFARVSQASGALGAYRTVDVDRGEILFDGVALGQGRWLVAGSAGYTQNPDGASVFEPAAPLLAVLEADGSVRSRIPFAAGPRINELRSLAPLGGHWLVAGMANGPGTHSGDGNRALITADGFVHETVVSP